MTLLCCFTHPRNCEDNKESPVHKPFRTDEQYFRMCLQIRSNWLSETRWDTVSNSCVSAEGNVDVSTVRSLFRHESSTIFVAITKEAGHLLNNMVAEASHEKKDLAGKMLLEEDTQIPILVLKCERVMVRQNLSKRQGVENGKIGSVLDAQHQC